MDNMQRKVAEIYEREVNDRVNMLSSLLEPLMMVVLRIVFGDMVIAMHLPIFQLRNVLKTTYRNRSESAIIKGLEPICRFAAHE